MKKIKNTSHKKYILISIIVIILSFVLYKHFFKKQITEEHHANKLYVNTKIVKLKDITLTNKYIGNVTPINSVSVLPFISGFIDKVLVKGGDKVKKNQTLFKINQAKYKADLDIAYANVLEAKANLTNAKLLYERVKLAGPEGVSQTDIDNAKTSFLLAEADLASSISNYDLAKINYDYTIIKSTISGIVGDVVITKGDYVSPQNTPLVKIIQYNPIRVVFSISNKEYINEIKENNKKPFFDWVLNLKLSNGNMYKNTSSIKFIDNEISPLTSSIKLYADFENINNTLLPNSYVDVILQKDIKDAILIPQNSVYLEPTDSYVYILKNGKVSKKSIKIDNSINNDFIIKEGLKDGEIIILDKISPFDLKKEFYPKEKE